MKAYMVYSGNPQDGCLLVYAETANKAKSHGCKSLFDWDYVDISAKRVKSYDQYFDGISVVETNDELHFCAPNFYTEEL